MKTEGRISIGDTVYTVLSSYTTIGLMMIRGGVQHPEWVPDDLIETGHAMEIERWERPGLPGPWMHARSIALQLMRDLVADHPAAQEVL